MGTYDDLMVLLQGDDARSPRQPSGHHDPWQSGATNGGAESVATAVGTLIRVADGVWIELRRRGPEVVEAERRIDELRTEQWRENLPEPFSYRLPDLSRLRAELVANDVSHDEQSGCRADPRPSTADAIGWRLQTPAGATTEVERYCRSTNAALEELRRSADATVHRSRIEIERVAASLHELFAFLESREGASSRAAYSRVLQQLADEGAALDAALESWEDRLRQWIRRCRSFEEGRTYRVEQATAQAFLQTRAYAVVLRRPDAAQLAGAVFDDMYSMQSSPLEHFTPGVGWPRRAMFSRDEWVRPGTAMVIFLFVVLAVYSASSDGSALAAAVLAAAVTVGGTLVIDKWAYRRALQRTLASDYRIVRSTDPRFDAVVALEALAQNLDDRMRSVRRQCQELPEELIVSGTSVRRLAWDATRAQSPVSDEAQYRVAARQVRALDQFLQAELDDFRASLESNREERMNFQGSDVWSQLVLLGDQVRAHLDALRQVLRLETRSVDGPRSGIEQADLSTAEDRQMPGP